MPTIDPATLVLDYDIQKLICSTQDPDRPNLVTNVVVELRAHDGQGHLVRSTTLVALTPSADPATPFTPFEQLTQEQVRAWIDASTDFAQQREFMARLMEQQINPPVVDLAPPWIPVPEVVSTSTATESVSTGTVG